MYNAEIIRGIVRAMIVKILTKFRKYNVGDKVAVDECDGQPSELFWRKRLRDSDAEIVIPEKPTKAKAEE